MRYTNLLQDNPLNNVAIKMDNGLKAQCNQGVIVANYCQSIISQAFVDFGTIQKLKPIETKINTGLEKAKSNANYYLGTLQAEIVSNLSKINNYFGLYDNVPIILPNGSSNEQWINMLKVLEGEAAKYSLLSKNTADKIGVFYVEIGKDYAEFNGNVAALNGIVNGNEGVLKDLEKQIADLDGQIDGLIAGVALSGFAIVGGIFIIAVGAVAGLVTAGTSTPIVVAGAVLLAAGVAGSIGLGIALANAIQAKSDALSTKINLEGEVKAIAGISASYSDLTKQVGNAQKAAVEMKNAWDFLSNDLGALAYDLDQGIISGDEIRKLWLTAANNTVGTIKNDINIIQGQMTGLQIANAPNNESLEQFVRNQARSQSSLSFPDAFSRHRYN